MSKRDQVGTVKWFNDSKGYGMIQQDGEEWTDTNIFAHYSEIQGQEFKTLAEGQRVKFDREGILRPSAVNIRKLEER